VKSPDAPAETNFSSYSKTDAMSLKRISGDFCEGKTGAIQVSIDNTMAQ